MEGNINGVQAHRSKNLTEMQRQDIYAALLEKSRHGKLPKKATTHVAEMFNVSRWAVQRVWKRVKQCRQAGIPVDVRSRKPKNCGRKKVPIDLSHVAQVPLQRRGTIRHLATAIGKARSTLHRWFKEGMLRRHSNSLKPLLKAKNIKDRLLWCLAMIDPTSLPDDPKFYDMLNIIHVDEKWYNASQKNRKFYLLPDEEDPHRTVQNKNAIDKVMFFSGVALPRWNDEGVCTFDGKLGMWAFVKKVWYIYKKVFALPTPQSHIIFFVFRSQQRERVEIELGEP
jgi:hypothetical protein